MLLFGAGGQPANIEHVGLYLGEGRMVHAPQTGQTVTIAANLWQPGGYWARRFVGGVRGLPADASTPSPREYRRRRQPVHHPRSPVAPRDLHGGSPR